MLCLLANKTSMRRVFAVCDNTKEPKINFLFGSDFGLEKRRGTDLHFKWQYRIGELTFRVRGRVPSMSTYISLYYYVYIYLYTYIVDKLDTSNPIMIYHYDINKYRWLSVRRLVIETNTRLFYTECRRSREYSIIRAAALRVCVYWRWLWRRAVILNKLQSCLPRDAGAV